MPRIVIAGTSSGSGKTTTVCGLLGIFRNKGLNPLSYKCGPDYIDPMFHTKVIGVKSRNLDLFFNDNDSINRILADNEKGKIAVIEGVMGFYDGVTIDSEKGSTFDLSNKTKSPVILVVNCKGMANSILATIKGFTSFRENKIKGVILNNITETTYLSVKKSIENEFSNKILVLGFIPKLPLDLILESRHLGLKTANEIEDLKLKLDKLSEVLTQTLEVEKIIEIANSAEKIDFTEEKIEKICDDVNIAVAYDNAFCFYYSETFEMLKKLGAKITFFSPLEDEKLPENIDGIYLGGGYPELYAKKLSENISMKIAIKNSLVSKIPCVAECGGFMYLTEKIEDEKMVGFIKTECTNMNKLVRFGYVNLTAKDDNLLCKKGEILKGHEFHYYDTTSNGNGFVAEKISKLSWETSHSDEYLYAGFPHLSFDKKIGENFIKKCIERKKSLC